MMRILRNIVVLSFVPIFLPVALADATPQKRRPATKSVSARPYGPRYAASVQGVTCENAPQRIASVLSDEPILASLQQAMADQIIDTKGEFETTAAFQQRHTDKIDGLFGNARRIVVVRKLGQLAKYDADTGIMSIDLFKLGMGGTDDPRLNFGAYLDMKDRGSFTGVNGFGATRTVSSTRFTETAYGFDNFDGNLAPKLVFPLSASEARQMKATGVVAVIADRESRPVYTRFDHDKATFDNPSETYWRFNYVRVQPLCAFVGSNGKFTQVLYPKPSIDQN